MSRRAFLKTLLAAPLTAKAAVEAGAQEVGRNVMSQGIALGSPAITESSPLERAFYKARRRLEKRIAVPDERFIPARIRTKKSWSPAFKEYAWRLDQEEMSESWNFQEMSEIEQIALMKRFIERYGRDG